MFSKLKKKYLLNVKNVIGWKTDRKIIVFSVDDYGNVRLDSKEARERLTDAGIPINSRFDVYDALETRQDLEGLYGVLTSVKDKNGRPAVFTPYALPCNINFEKIRKRRNQKYYYELLPKTFEKQTVAHPDAYVGAWELWKEGIRSGLMIPQFHGREHMNLKVFKEGLDRESPELLIQLNNRSFVALSDIDNKTISPLAAFDFWEFDENKNFHTIIEDGIKQFKKVFGYYPQNFTPPSYNVHPVLYKTLANNGIRFVDQALYAKEHQGRGKAKKRFNYLGKQRSEIKMMVRNVVFEPTEDRGINWVTYAIKQIAAAFRWNKPAIVSSHRVNFCGHIDRKNRKKGLNALQELLTRIVSRWPDVEFMSADELGEVMDSA